MKDPRELRRRWRRTLDTQFRRVQRHLESGAVPDAEAVHELRVSLRRVRTLLDALDPEGNRARVQRLRRRARRLSRSLAPVRDLDVCLDWARGHGASPELLARLQARRDRWMARVRFGRRRVAVAWRAAGNRLPRRPPARRLARRIEGRMAEWVDAVRAGADGGVVRSLPRLHRLRRDVRRWRYLRELCLAPTTAARDPLLRRLVSLQEALGEVQNRVVVRAILRSIGRSQEGIRLRARLREEQVSAVATVHQRLAKGAWGLAGKTEPPGRRAAVGI